MTAGTRLPPSKDAVYAGQPDDLDELEKRAMEGCPHHSIGGANLQTVCVCFEQSAHEILTLIAEARALRWSRHVNQLMAAEKGSV